MLKTLLSTCGFSTLLSIINLVQYCFGEFVSKLGQLIISFTVFFSRSQFMFIKVLHAYFHSELLNSARRDPVMLREVGEAKKMHSLMSWRSFFHCLVPLLRSWTKHRLCASQSVTWTWSSLTFLREVRIAWNLEKDDQWLSFCL